MQNILSLSVISLLLFVAFPIYALTVSPAKIEITVDPGAEVTGEIEIFNEQNETKTFYLSYENFESRGDSGAPYFIGADEGLATWIQTQESVTIASGERIFVPYTILVPQGARPGGHFAAIFFGTEAPQSMGGGEVSIGGKIGVLVLLRVNGDVEESAGLGQFSTKDNSLFFSSLPIAFEYTFNNAGGDRVIPKGEIKIQNTFRFTSATLLANDREGSVLPDSSRRFDVVWGEGAQDASSKGFFESAWNQLTNFHAGWYTAELSLTWGNSAQTGSSMYHFFIIPWQLLSIVLGIGALLFGVFHVWAAQFKRRILKEAMRRK